MENDIIFEPLEFPTFTVKNRIFRSNMSGRWDNYDGSGSQARINWEEKFARGGVGAIISSFVPVHVRGRIVPNYAMIDNDTRIPFWRKVGEKAHEYDCHFIMQLSHSGRQRDVSGIENQMQKAWSSTDSTDPFHGLLCRAMTTTEVKETIQQFADGARRAREAGLDGVELHGANGYLITQFLSKGINDRKDEYGGSLENRARFVLDIIRAIRKEVGDDFHLQMKISAIDYNEYPFPWEKKGNTLEDSIQICKWIEEAGANAIHVSTGSLFPHPLNPVGGFPLDTATRTYDSLLSSGIYAFRNYLLFRFRPLRPIFNYLWFRVRKRVGQEIEGVSVEAAAAIKQNVNVPVICTGGFQNAAYIRQVINDGKCDAVSIARSLVANNDLVNIFAEGRDEPERPCTFCNKCLLNVPENPLGCYELSRFDGDYDEMIEEVLSVFQPPDFQ
jgi:2,4-dienoyl-CoA reductase (NADPH2)